jgi:eukaryotic-like serine/threonine-protein kinase
MSSPNRWKEVSELYALALERPVQERQAFVASACGEDDDLRQQVQSLLRDHEVAQQTLQAPAAEQLARTLASETAALVGRQLDAYRIEAPLGSGGMGEVYRATDMRLHRAVALKILPPDLRSDPALRHRFEREAQAIAALRHPHICVLYDVGQADGIDFLVMELLEGETLAARLARGPLPADEAVARALEIADALSAIHQRGMVHRDLKPGNVMLTASGAKLLDFGLAKMPDARVPGSAAGTTSLLALDTSTAAGTLPYMTPEQLDRDDIDHRSDLFAFGAVLYEMVTGRKAFDGDGRDAVMAAIRNPRPVPLSSALQTSAPGLQQLIDRCLRKNPDERWPDAQALVHALQHVRDTAAGQGWTPLRLAAAGVAASLIIGFLTWIAWSLGAPRVPAASPQLVLGAARPLAATEQFEMDPAWSPRGDVMAYAAGRGTNFRIIVRDVATNATLPGPPASDAEQLQPRWSPDGSRLLYITRDGVFVWAVGETSARRIASPWDVPGSYTAIIGNPFITGAAWSPDGREIAVAFGGALYAVAVDGGRRRHLATAVEELHWCDWSRRATWISCTAGNHHLPFYGTTFGNIAPSAVVIVPSAGGRIVPVAPKTASNQSPVWSHDGRHLYFVSNRQGRGDVYGVSIGETGAPTGEPVRITTGLDVAAIAISADRRKLAYSALTARANLWSVQLPTPGSRADPAAARQLTFGNQVIEAMHVTPDGKWLVYDSDLSGNAEIYRMPVDGGEPERLTSDPAGDFGPQVSRDGRLAYFSWRTKSRDVFVQPFEGGPVEQVTATAAQESYPKWLPDGSLLFVDQTVENGILRGLFVTRRGSDGQWTQPELVASDAYAGAVISDGAILYSHKGGVYMRRPGSRAPVSLYEPPGPGQPRAGLFLIPSNDERVIYTKSFDSAGRATFYWLPVSGGRLTEFMRIDDLTRPSSRFEFAIGVGRLLFTVDDRRSNIWIADVAER